MTIGSGDDRIEKIGKKKRPPGGGWWARREKNWSLDLVVGNEPEVDDFLFPVWLKGPHDLIHLTMSDTLIIVGAEINHDQERMFFVGFIETDGTADVAAESSHFPSIDADNPEIHWRRGDSTF
jgi:hypothetical protein